MWRRLTEQQWREKEDQAYSRWLDLRRRGPRGWLITTNIFVFLGGCAAFLFGFVGLGWYGWSIAIAAVLATCLLIRESTSDECFTTAIILACLSAACYGIVIAGCATGSNAYACH